MKLTQLLLEISLDNFVENTSYNVLKYISETKKFYKLGKETEEIGPRNAGGYYVKKFKVYNDPLVFTLFIGIKRTNKVDDKTGFETDASTDDKSENNEILITIKLDPDKEPQIYNKLLGHIKDDLRHELEHLTQEDLNKEKDKVGPTEEEIRDKINKLTKDKFKYFLMKDEIPAMVEGMKAIAKHENNPIETVFNEYLQDFVDDNTITNKQKQFIIKTWMKYYNEEK